MPLHRCFRMGICLVLTATTLLLTACASKTFEIWRQIPIQMSRISQTESYQQTFLIITPSIKEKEDSEREKALDERMDNIFNKLAGAKNWQHLKNLYGISSVRNELMTGRIHMDGLINFNAYLDPTDRELNHLVIEGSGRYFAIRDETDAILMSGDFHIPPQRYSITSLTQGCLPLDIKMYISRIPGKTTYYKDITVRYDLIIDTNNARDNAYSINYNAEHFAFLDLDNNDEFDAEKELIGVLRLNGQYHQAKLFDIRGKAFIKREFEFHQQTQVSDNHAERRCIKYIAPRIEPPPNSE